MGRVNRRSPAAWVILLAAGAAAAPAAGQPEDQRNAATWYRRAMERLEAVSISEAEWEAVRGYLELHDIAEPPPAVREVLGRLEPVFGAVHRAARQERSDFELDYGQGFDLTLPHLGGLRSITRLMSASAAARLAAGESDAAAAEIGSLYRLAGHVGADEVLISSLVGRAVFEQADRVAGLAIDRGVFDAAQSLQVLEGLDGLGGDDPFAAIDALRREKTTLTEWVGEKYAERAARADVLDDFNADDSGLGALAGVMLLDQRQFESALEQTGQVMDRAIELFQLEDPIEARLELEALGREIARGEYGGLAMFIAPNLERAYEGLAASRDRIAMRRAQLLAIAEGVVAPEDLANAALWYLEAIERMKSLSPEGFRAVRALLDEPRQVPGAMARVTLENAAAAIALLETGSRHERCDFSIARRRASALPGYLPPLRDAARLLHADALRLLHEGQPRPAAGRLAVAFRLSAHLAADGLPASSLVAHAVFATTAALLPETHGLLTASERRALLDAAGYTSRLDPFGHVAARIEARDAAAAWLQRTAGPAAPLDEVVRRAHALEGDRLLRLLLSIGGEDAAVDAGPLDDVIAPEAIDWARGQAAAFRQRVRAGDLAAIDEPVEAISRIEEPIASARAELERALRALASGLSDEP